MSMPAQTQNTTLPTKIGLPVLLGMSVVILVAFLLIFPASLNFDVSWLLYMSQETQAGKTPYVDMLAVNPPLILWLNMPSVFFAKMTGLGIGIAFKIYIFSLIAMSLALVGHILRRLKLPYGAVTLLVLTYALAILPEINFGQRSHVMLILGLPYIFTVVARAQQINLPTWLLLFSAVMAATGFCIKPYYVFVPALLELYLLFALGVATFRRPEPYIMFGFAVLYLVSVFIFTPGYTSDYLQYARAVYGAGYAANITGVVTPIIPVINTALLGGAFMYLVKLKFSDIPVVFRILILVGIAGGLNYFIQFKGWSTHAYPMRAASLVLAMSAFTLLWKAPVLRLVKTSFMGLLTLLILSFAVFPVISAEYKFHRTNLLKTAVSEYPDAQTIFVMSAEIQDGFPLTTELGLIWGSRFPTLGLIPGLQKRKAKGESSAILDEIELFNRATVAQDLQHFKPELVFVHNVEQKKHFEGVTFDYLSDFSKNAEFRQEWTQYEFIKTVEHLDMYHRRAVEMNN